MIELAVLLEPRHGATYEQILALAQAAEQSGLDAFFRSDHYLGVDPADAGYRPTDSWITLAGLARETSRIQLGTLTTCGTFRLPGPLAVAVGTANGMSGGRIELGLGAGWYGEEHTQFGVPFPPMKERFDRLEEQLEILTGLWNTPAAEPFSYHGQHWQIENSVAFPGKWPAPKLIVGGMGPRRTPSLAARFADEFNAAFAPLEQASERFALVRRLAEEAGRDPATLKTSIVIPRLCVGETDADVARRVEILGPPVGEIPDQGLAGSPEYIAERLSEWVQGGAQRIYVHQLEVEDLDHIRLLGERVRPLLRSVAV
jgi:F420-dependent oxidoreductase-like protein